MAPLTLFGLTFPQVTLILRATPLLRFCQSILLGRHQVDVKCGAKNRSQHIYVAQLFTLQSNNSFSFSGHNRLLKTHKKGNMYVFQFRYDRIECITSQVQPQTYNYSNGVTSHANQYIVLNTITMVSSQQGYAKTTTDLTGNPRRVDEAQSNLPLPEQPPVASDFNSADARTVNVGSGSVEGGISSGGGSLREPAVGHAGSSGREAKDGLGGIPNDAVTRDQKNHAGLEDTTSKDYGYPGKNDPSAGVKQ